jgi:hypothetical protein
MSLLGLARIDQSLDVFGQLVAPPTLERVTGSNYRREMVSGAFVMVLVQAPSLTVGKGYSTMLVTLVQGGISTLQGRARVNLGTFMSQIFGSTQIYSS